MAHVLLPCDLPTWVDVQRHLAQLKTCKDATQMVEVMVKVYEICCISLDPDDMQPKKDHSGFQELKHFVDEVLGNEAKLKFLKETLPSIVSHALSLRMLKPHNGFLYSLKKEEETFELERAFVVSLLANAFLNTFPKRNSKTHPTLQDFSFADFFTHLTKRSHQKKFKVFLRYFETLDAKPSGVVKFSRRAVSGPSLPGWLCSDRSLAPLIVRFEGNVHDAEPQVFRACPCTALIGGDVLRTATSQEANLFFSFPELLVSLSFVECLEANEALVVEGATLLGSSRRSSKQGYHVTNKVNFCLLDATDFSEDRNRQFDDAHLLRELNKALAAFAHSPREHALAPEFRQRRQTPVGESSSSEPPSSGMVSSSHSSSSALEQRDILQGSRKRSPKRSSMERKERHGNNKRCREGQQPVTEVKESSYFPPITKSVSEDIPRETQSRRSSVASAPAIDNRVTEWPKVPGLLPSKAGMLKTTSGSHSSSRLSMKTASQSSVELPPIQPLRDDEYYTADEDSGEGSGQRRPVLEKDRRTSGAMTELLRKEELDLDYLRKHGQGSNKGLSRDSSSEVSRGSRSESFGFVLGGGGESEEECDFPNQHEKLEDFRKRIRKRNRRRLSRRSSRSSYLGSSGSSDMEDISEDPELPMVHAHAIRPASSEPSILTALEDGERAIIGVPPFTLTADTVILSLGGRKMMVTSSNGQLKAYSYDGVNPNLPVPFKAKFRRRRHHSEEGEKSLDKEEFLWSASMIERNSSLDDLSSRSSKNVKSPSVETDVRDTDEVVRQAKLSKRWPVAVEPWGCSGEDGDCQLKTIILWLAASMADLPFLIFYTAQEPSLNEINTVYSKVLSRHWTVGDLSCEVLRFCRNRLSPRRRLGGCVHLFGQLLGSEASAASFLSYNLSQQSLD